MDSMERREDAGGYADNDGAAMAALGRRARSRKGSEGSGEGELGN